MKTKIFCMSTSICCSLSRARQRPRSIASQTTSVETLIPGKAPRMKASNRSKHTRTPPMHAVSFDQLPPMSRHRFDSSNFWTQLLSSRAPSLGQVSNSVRYSSNVHLRNASSFGPSATKCSHSTSTSSSERPTRKRRHNACRPSSVGCPPLSVAQSRNTCAQDSAKLIRSFCTCRVVRIAASTRCAAVCNGPSLTSASDFDTRGSESHVAASEGPREH
mmetsp:Transcript_118950/g.336436  ORF Transcript_118950/g.336436 Transcript_118950/m.336436 type:complete len:218 (+) Transcript_118950:820-1473(+)